LLRMKMQRSSEVERTHSAAALPNYRSESRCKVPGDNGKPSLVARVIRQCRWERDGWGDGSGKGTQEIERAIGREREREREKKQRQRQKKIKTTDRK